MSDTIKDLIKKYREISEEKLSPYSSDEECGYHDGKVDLAEDIVYDLERLQLTSTPEGVIRDDGIEPTLI